MRTPRRDARGRCARAFAAALALASRATLAGEPALAQSSPGPDEPPDTFAYTTPAEKHYLRAVVEVAAILVVGEVQYQAEQSNSRDWDLGYDWPSFRKKLSGEALRFDTNRFDTNMVTHPVAGSLYYLAARGNRLDVSESFLYALAASTMWEYVGEVKEKASINDLVVTPLAGMVAGEALLQLGAMAERSGPTPVSTALAWLFAPTKRVHDAADGVTPYRGAGDTAHRLALDVGAGSTMQPAASPRPDARFALRSHVMHVPGHDSPGRTSLLLHDANVSTIEVDATVAGGALADFQLFMQISPIGWYAKALSRREGALEGQRVFLGATVGFDYGRHLYDPRGASQADAISGVHAGGARLEHDLFLPPLHLRTTMELRGGFAAVHALALDAYLARHAGDTRALPSVVQEQGYYYATSVAVAPAVEASVGPVSVGAVARLDTYWSIGGYDRYQEQLAAERALHDRRTLARGWLGYAPTPWLALKLGVDWRTRSGELGDAAALRDETSTWASVGAVLR